MLLQQILLDGGSDQCILNFFYLHLFLSLKPLTYRCLLSGIGGDVVNEITHAGVIIFMGRTIENVYYCSDLSKSVMSESKLCQIYDFRILKQSSYCIITNLLTSKSTELVLGYGSEAGSGHYILPVTLFAHSPHIHNINLASVRPSNPLTLWHNRLGHTYTGLIHRP